MSESRVFSLGGYSNGAFVNDVYYLSLDSNAANWEQKSPMLYNVSSALAIQHNDTIYEVGGIDSSRNESTLVQKYIIAENKWYHCSNIPIPTVAGIVVYKKKITVLMVDSCLIYDAKTDT